VQETISTTPDDGLPPPRPRRFRLIALGVALAMFLPFAYIAYRNIADAVSDPGPGPNPGFPEPDFSLTDEQAMATFTTLHRGLVGAIQNQDLSLLSAVATNKGPIFDSASKEIRDLRQDRVQDRAKISIQEATVVSTGPNQTTLDAVFLVRPCFTNSQGEDVTQGPRAIEQHLTWTLRIEDDSWQIHEGTLNSDRVLRGEDDAC
jgi:hypothetical protein